MFSYCSFIHGLKIKCLQNCVIHRYCQSQLALSKARSKVNIANYFCINYTLYSDLKYLFFYQASGNPTPILLMPLAIHELWLLQSVHLRSIQCKIFKDLFHLTNMYKRARVLLEGHLYCTKNSEKLLNAFMDGPLWCRLWSLFNLFEQTAEVIPWLST